MQYTTLTNGVRVPMLGYGVFQIDNPTTETTVGQALEAGYRLIDTAQAYGNEEGVGAAVKASGLPREEVFIVTKVWVSNFGEGKTYDSIQQSLEKLGTDYIDLLLLHQPYGDYYGAWRDLEKAYDEGLVKAIGVSNFDSVRLLDLVTFSRIKPMVNQVESHVFRPQLAEGEIMRSLGVEHMAWGPFAEGMNGIFTNPTLVAIGKEHGKTSGQVALRYLLENKIISIPKSVRPERMAENFDIFDFELTAENRQQLAALAAEGFSCYDHNDLQTVSNLLNFIKGSMN